MSLKDIVKTWDVCARAVICEYAQQSGGGTFSSKYGSWENCSTAAWSKMELWGFLQLPLALLSCCYLLFTDGDCVIVVFLNWMLRFIFIYWLLLDKLLYPLALFVLKCVDFTSWVVYTQGVCSWIFFNLALVWYKG